MIFLEAPYFNINRILLQSTALWPFQQSKFARLQSIIILIILGSGILFQITIFITSELTPKFIVKVLSCVFFFITLLIHYSSFHNNKYIIKNLMKQLHYACTELKDKNEIAIIHKYGCNAKQYTMIITILFFIVSALINFGFGILIISPDIVSSANGSQLHRIQMIETEYFIDKQICFYLSIFHMNAAIFVGILAKITVGTFMLSYLRHTCAMFRIACYRIEHAMEINVPKSINTHDGLVIYKKIIYAINIHREAMKLSELLISRFDTMYLCLTVLSVIVLSLNLFQVFQVLISDDKIAEVLIPMTNAIILSAYMFLSNLIGQNITDHNNEVYATVYNIQWYMCSQRIQKLILLFLQRGVKDFHLTCGGLFIASFECFAMLAKTTMSYFTVMYSMR
ncbi:hypothetical protein HN011_001516 [Eciton burchellii]|nr:hypothetical protein HN011_001516 [Eciton burchellii]